MEDHNNSAALPFVHLHVHSHYSELDGMATVQQLVDKSIRTGMRAMALTDHGVMYGIKEFFDYANKKNKGKPDEEKFKPILGVEAYCARRTRHDKTLKEDGSGWHLVLMAKNKKGYQNLCKLVSLSWIEGYYYRPRIDKDLLKQYSEGLIVSSACLGGEVPKKISSNDMKAAEEAIYWFKDLFGEDFYLELQRHKTDKEGGDRTTYEKQKEVNRGLLLLAEKTNTKIIATNDVHFTDEDHAEAHDRLICLGTGKDLDDPNRMHYTKQEWLKTPEEMYAIFSDLPQALTNTLEIADKVEFYDIDSNALMPVFPIPEEFGTEESYRQQYTEEALREEFNKEDDSRFDKLGGYNKVIRIKLEADYLRSLTLEKAKLRYGEEPPKETMERIEFELETMKTMGFPGYFLIVQDFIQAARDMGVAVGPGRGSAAGSAVAYCLGITDIDPLKYDLLFERFLNPDRISMPDIDIDFDDDGRGRVLNWVTEKYGKERVAHIITYGTMGAKSAIKDVGRVEKLPLNETTQLTKYIPNSFPEDKKTGKAPKVNLTNCYQMVTEFREANASTDRTLTNTLKYAQMLEGTVRQVGVHACGVIIGADDLTNYVPLRVSKDKSTNEDLLVTQYEGSVVESVGLIKMDFLGLKNLSIIKEAISNIKKSKGIDIRIDQIPIDDAKTYELYSKGQTVGTFQFESAGMQKYLKELEPTRFEDLIAMNALYRPGPMQYIPSFINRKHGREPIEYDFPEMESRLKDTYGITVYQEQVMLLSRDLAGFTRGESDELRKAMGKKLIDKMNQLKTKFIDGATKKGFGPLEKLEKIWNDWAEFAKYAFNKSHATCYSWVSYQTAYLKANYPSEFMAANLTRNKDDIGEITKFMDECKSMGIRVLPPDVNESDMNFTANQDGDIRFGLGGIKNVGSGAVEYILSEREANGPYTDIFDFVERVNLTACNKKNIESLALAGAFDNFKGMTREQYFEQNGRDDSFLDTLIRYGNKYQLDKASAQNSLFGGFDSVEIARPAIPEAEPWSRIERLNREKELVGIYLSSHPLDDYYVILNYLCTVKLADFAQAKETLHNQRFTLGGIITDAQVKRSKFNDREFGILKLEDFSGSAELVLFGNDFIEYFSRYGRISTYVYVTGMFVPNKYKPERIDFKIESFQPLQDIKEKGLKRLTVTLPLDQLDEVLIAELSSLSKNGQPGTAALKLQIKDTETDLVLPMVADNMKIFINKQLINYLERREIEFTVNG